MSPSKEFKKLVLFIPIVNDAPERNIHLLRDFVSISHDEDLTQDLFLVIEG